jgi:hypothetical protein
MWWKGWLSGIRSNRRFTKPFRQEIKDREDRLKK